MSEPWRDPARSRRVSKRTAAQILQRAADLDAVGDEMIELEELRIAAQDAGISARSFELSLAELKKHRESATGQPRGAGRRVSYLAVFGAGILGGVGALGLVSLGAGPPPEDAIVGALVGGGGAVVTTLAYLRSALRRRTPQDGAAAVRTEVAEETITG